MGLMLCVLVGGGISEGKGSDGRTEWRDFD